MNLKAGEEKKIKHYLALCICSDPIEPESLQKLGDIKDLTLSQKTPVRVLHRRPLATRSRTVHSMRAWLLDNPTKLCKNGKDISHFVICSNIVLMCILVLVECLLYCDDPREQSSGVAVCLFRSCAASSLSISPISAPRGDVFNPGELSSLLHPQSNFSFLRALSE
jgi:hypothetical protein